jgi:hypothetical protein
MGLISLWVLAACSSRAPAPERSFEVVAQEDWGPCNCPGPEPAKSIWLALGDGSVAPAASTGLSKDCAVEVTGAYPAGGGPLPKETRTAARELGAEPNAFRCPNPWGKIRFHQKQESSQTLFHNLAAPAQRASVSSPAPSMATPCPWMTATVA